VFSRVCCPSFFLAEPDAHVAYLCESVNESEFWMITQGKKQAAYSPCCYFLSTQLKKKKKIFFFLLINNICRAEFLRYFLRRNHLRFEQKFGGFTLLVKLGGSGHQRTLQAGLIYIKITGVN